MIHLVWATYALFEYSDPLGNEVRSIQKCQPDTAAEACSYSDAGLAEQTEVGVSKNLGALVGNTHNYDPRPPRTCCVGYWSP